MHRNIRVAIRVRPFSTRELESNQKSIVRVLDDKNLLFDPEDDQDEFFFHGAKIKHRDITRRMNKKLTMDFDHVFDTEAQNVNVYEGCMQTMINAVMDGYNCSIFVYGATGAGKTHTMLGNEEEAGIVFMTVRELFETMDSQSVERHFDIGVSYLEVYNELVMNLLHKSSPLKLRENSHGVEVGGLSLMKITNAEELINLLVQGNKNRTQHPTDANAESSRSHAIFQVHIRMIDRKTNQKKTVKLSMIDLAGSERAASTKCMGLRFKEGANINKSLLALGNCINKLADGSKHVPYRDSNLTRILKDSLGGNCQTLMIANISPSSLTYEDTYNTLKYASSAKKIRTLCKQNIVSSTMPKEYYVNKMTTLEEENFKLKELLRLSKQEVEELKAALAKKNATPVVVTQTQALAPAAAAVTAPEASRPQLIVTAPSFEEDLSEWEDRLTAVYEKLRADRKKYWMMKSKEKILMLKIKFKDHVEELKKKIYFDGSRLTVDLAKLLASTDRFGKQINSQHEFLTICRNNLNDSFAELNGLLSEIRSNGLESKLALFIANKEFEMQAFFGKISTDHCNKLIALFKSEAEQAREALMMCGELAQEQFLLLRGNNVEVDMQEQQDALLAILDNKSGVRFTDENLQDTLTKLTDLTKDAELGSPVSGQRSSFDAAKVLSAMATKKRRNMFDAEEPVEGNNKVRVVETNGGEPLEQKIIMPTRNKGCEMDGVDLLPVDDQSVFNGTFQMPPKGSALNETVNIVTKSVLKEQSLNKIMSQPGLVTKMAKSTKGMSRSGDAGARLTKKTTTMIGGDLATSTGRGSPNRVAKARLAASRTGVAALKSKTGGGGGSGERRGSGGSGSAHKRWK